MTSIAPEHIIKLLSEGEFVCASASAQIITMCHDNDVRISEGRAPREELLGAYKIRLEHVHGDKEQLSVVVSSLAKYHGDWVRIVAINTPSATGGLLISDDGTILAALARLVEAR